MTRYEGFQLQSWEAEARVSKLQGHFRLQGEPEISPGYSVRPYIQKKKKSYLALIMMDQMAL